MAIKQDKYEIQFQNDYAIKRNQIFFDFMLQMFNHLDELYLHEKCPLIDTIKTDQQRKQSSVEILKSEQRKKFQKQKKGSYI